MPEITITNARLVGGHPMDYKQKTNDANAPAFKRDGSPQMECYFYIAVPKAGADWRATDWGAMIAAEAARAFKTNEVAAPDFSWKVIDGDSTAPMRGGKPAPATREGYQGHWVVRCTTGFPVKVFHHGRYDPMDQVQDRNELKCGDYVSVRVDILANNVNGYAQTNGIFINPKLVRIDRAGALIVTDSDTSAAEAFGDTPAPAPAPAPTMAPPPPPHNPLPPVAEPRYNVSGRAYTASELRGFGWTDAQIATAEKVS